jgi:hypothetical protein
MEKEISDMDREIAHRLDIRVKAMDSEDLQGVEIASCKQDILYWFKHYAWTDRNTSLFNSDVA